MRSLLGDDYIDWLKQEFRIGVKDYCVYWFRRAHDHLSEGGRAGLVGTNSISQNFGRGASLDYIAQNHGQITQAVSTQDWSGEAAVDVSIVNWIKVGSQRQTSATLDGRPVPGITTSLRSSDEADVATAVRLPANHGISFEGVKPGGRGFVLTQAEAESLRARTDAEYGDVVRPYLAGNDIANDSRQQPTRWIIDFETMPLQSAGKYAAALAIVKERVKPERDVNRRAVRRERWWLFSEPVPALRLALSGLSRYMASNV